MKCKVNLILSIKLSFLLVFNKVFCVQAHDMNPELLPPMLDSDDISYFSSTYDIESLHWALSNVFERSERNPYPTANLRINPLPQAIISKGGGSTYTTAYKIKQDLEQANYLIQYSLQMDDQMKQHYKDVVIPTLEKILRKIPSLDELHRTGGLYGFRQTDYESLGIHNIYNKAFHNPEYSYESNNILSETFQKNKYDIQKQWFESKNPGIIVVDDLLSPTTLSTIQTLLLESTVWYQTKMPKKFGGYVGAYIDDGLHHKILLALAFELHKALPDIMTGHDLQYLWAYKYDSEYTGINTHADQAAVNVNIWLTPDEANLDPNSGGLVIYTTKPPPDWDFHSFNADTERVEKDILEPTNYANVTVPYKTNRAVIFDSALFHHTDSFSFKSGYKNRRINLTILYGEMQRQCRNNASC